MEFIQRNAGVFFFHFFSGQINHATNDELFVELHSLYHRIFVVIISINLTHKCYSSHLSIVTEMHISDRSVPRCCALKRFLEAKRSTPEVKNETVGGSNRCEPQRFDG